MPITGSAKPLFPFSAGKPYVFVEMYAYPVFFIHMVCRRHSFVTLLQIHDPVGSAFDIAEIECLDVYEAKPFFRHAEDEQVPVVCGSRFLERHLFIGPLERKAVGPEIFDIHRLNV